MPHLDALASEDIRDSCILILNEYLPLESINSAQELKKVFRDVITGFALITSSIYLLTYHVIRRALLGMGSRRRLTWKYQSI